LNGEFIAALLTAVRRRLILALLVPREHKVDHSNALKKLTDEQLEAMIEYLTTSLEAQAGGSVRVIEGTTEPAAAMAPAPQLMLETVTAVGPRERMPKLPLLPDG